METELVWQAGDDAMHATLSRRRLLCRSAGIAAGTAWSSLAFAANDYPSRPIRLIVSSAAGSSPDVIARLIAAEMSISLQQQVVVDNRAGASSIIGTNVLAKASPDGYTIGYVTPAFVLNRALRSQTPFDADRDFQPVIQCGHQPLMLVVSNDSTYETLPKLIEAASNGSSRLTYASTGQGSIFHLATELFFQSTRTQAVHVTYTSGPQAINDLIGGRVDFMFNAFNTLVPHVQAGRLRGLGVSSVVRSATLAGIPTIIEQGVEKFEVVTWGGLIAPAAVSPDVLVVLNASANTALATPHVQQTLIQTGYEIVGGSALSFGGFMQDELRKWREVVRQSRL